jgi:hypothetical protein
MIIIYNCFNLITAGAWTIQNISFRNEDRRPKMTSPGTEYQSNTQVSIISHENHHQEQAIKIGKGKESRSDEGLSGGKVSTHIDRSWAFAAISATSQFS